MTERSFTELDYLALRLLKHWWSASRVWVIKNDEDWSYATDPHRDGRLELSVTLDEARSLVGSVAK